MTPLSIYKGSNIATDGKTMATKSVEVHDVKQLWPILLFRLVFESFVRLTSYLCFTTFSILQIKSKVFNFLFIPCTYSYSQKKIKFAFTSKGNNWKLTRNKVVLCQCISSMFFFAIETMNKIIVYNMWMVLMDHPSTCLPYFLQ